MTRPLPVLMLTLLLTGGCVEALENSLIFFPDKRIEATPHNLDLAYEEISFTTQDGVRLNGWWIPGAGSPFTLLWFHGNGGNISYRLDNIKRRHDLLGTSIFIFDYRGYGRSEGRTSEEGTYRDGDAAIRYLRSRGDVDPNKIVFLGESLGSAVAVEMAIRHGCAALVLESPFLSIAEMAKVTFPLLPIGSFIQTKYDTLSKIGQVSVPLLIVHGDSDEIVPFRHGQRLFESANEPKEFYRIKDAHHNDLYVVGGTAYLETLNRFLSRMIGDTPSP
ncbi:MAG: alpha/beta hydrolase [Candidatus Methylomirabilis oxygeniifera]|uniref:Putative enzyme (3.4.-) n=1 Tax=Methylomirabilis oxygeniifera TaxID=671143 RepID=D5MMG8_METO1|nr:MAG: alpha/beta hydrolase [Candidatus Methylomirabilis oxyfera]CBE70090.1 putative enzyme (3.4.-) [Candidatus Methylomirabilis oxyfera]